MRFPWGTRMQKKVRQGKGSLSIMRSGRLYTFSVPMNSMCSTAWAKPGISGVSLKLPTFTSSAPLALSVSGSWMRRASSWFGRRMTLYERSSRAGRSMLSATRSGGVLRLSTGALMLFFGRMVGADMKAEVKSRGGVLGLARVGSEGKVVRSSAKGCR